jgi:GTP-binding protein Era
MANNKGNKLDQKNKLQHGFIAIVGAPNAGKSTITNAIVGQKISIVSPRVQTTRNSIKAIAIRQNKQIILLDTPGIFIPRQEKILERIIVKSAWQALRQADHICFVIDASVGFDSENQRILKDLKKENLEITVIINKIDLVKKSKLLEIFAPLSENGIESIIPISALNNDGIDIISNIMASKCVNPEWIYSEDQISDAPMRFIASEITREKLFLRLYKELPYQITVKNDVFENLDNGDIRIRQTIFVAKESQKSIILGKKGNQLKEIGIEARNEIAQISGVNNVHLFLFIKVKDNWMNDEENFEMLDINKVPKV